MAVWFIGNIFGHINEVTLRQAGLVLRWVTVRRYTVMVFNQATQANSAWPSFRVYRRTGDGYGHRWGRNGEFCVAIDPVTRNVGRLTHSVKGAGC